MGDLEETALESLAGGSRMRVRRAACSHHVVGEICNAWIHAEVLHLRDRRSDGPSFLFHFAVRAQAEHGSDWNCRLCPDLPASSAAIEFKRKSQPGGAG